MRCGNPQCRQKIARTDPKMSVIAIQLCGVVRFGLWLGSLAGGK
jgi:hypothetical protein